MHDTFQLDDLYSMNALLAAWLIIFQSYRYICHFIFSTSPHVAVFVNLLNLSYNAFASTVIFQLLGECHCLLTKESPRAHVAKFYGRLWLICSVFIASKFSDLKLIEIVILWVYNTIPFSFSLVRLFSGIDFHLFNGHRYVDKRANSH